MVFTLFLATEYLKAHLLSHERRNIPHISSQMSAGSAKAGILGKPPHLA